MTYPTSLSAVGAVIAAVTIAGTPLFAKADSQKKVTAEIPLTLYIVRHGETDWNMQGRIQGNTDNPLNAKGLEQAKAVGVQLEGVKLNRIYPSGLQRAVQTSQAIAGKGAPITPDKRLNERSRGIYEGKISSEVNEVFIPRFQALNDDMDGGESLLSISSRVSQATREIVKRHMGETIMIVGHSGVNPLVIGELISLPPERAITEIRQGNDEVYKLIISPKGKVAIWKLIPTGKLKEL